MADCFELFMAMLAQHHIHQIPDGKVNQDTGGYAVYPRRIYLVLTVFLICSGILICCLTVSDVSVQNAPWLFALILLSLGIAPACVAVRVIFSRIFVIPGQNEFRFRTAFGRTHTIRYGQCIGYTKTRGFLILCTAQKRFYVDAHATNLSFFLKELATHKVRRFYDE